MTALNNQNLLQLRFINQANIDLVKPSFDNLPANPYADGEFRKRRYSVIKFQNGELKLQAAKAFVQDDSINTFQGNVERTYENLEQSLLESDGMKSIVSEFCAITGIDEELSLIHI